MRRPCSDPTPISQGTHQEFLVWDETTAISCWHSAILVRQPNRTPREGAAMSSASVLTGAHMERAPYVYVRQSSEFQVQNKVERQRLQYALAEHTRGKSSALRIPLRDG